MLVDVKTGCFTVCAVNEDAVGYAGDCAWVLDGSTGLNGKRLVAEAGSSDARWYAQAFHKYLQQTLPGSAQPLPELFSQGVARVWAEFLQKAGGAVDRADTPCIVGTALRLRDGFLEYICVGDCCLLLREKSGRVTELLDHTLCRLDEGSLELGVQLAKEKGLPLSQCRQLLLPRLQQVRMTMNTPQGYISLADDPASVLKAKTGRVPVDSLRDICMVSDGFREYYQMFALAEDLEDFMDQAASQTPRALFDRMLAAQQADGDFVKHPRFKLSDDSAILYAKL